MFKKNQKEVMDKVVTQVNEEKEPITVTIPRVSPKRVLLGVGGAIGSVIALMGAYKLGKSSSCECEDGDDLEFLDLEPTTEED